MWISPFWIWSPRRVCSRFVYPLCVCVCVCVFEPLIPLEWVPRGRALIKFVLRPSEWHSVSFFSFSFPLTLHRKWRLITAPSGATWKSLSPRSTGQGADWRRRRMSPTAASMGASAIVSRDALVYRPSGSVYLCDCLLTSGRLLPLSASAHVFAQCSVGLSSPADLLLDICLSLCLCVCLCIFSLYGSFFLSPFGLILFFYIF